MEFEKAVGILGKHPLKECTKMPYVPLELDIWEAVSNKIDQNSRNRLFLYR